MISPAARRQTVVAPPEQAPPGQPSTGVTKENVRTIVKEALKEALEEESTVNKSVD